MAARMMNQQRSHLRSSARLDYRTRRQSDLVATSSTLFDIPTLEQECRLAASASRPSIISNESGLVRSNTSTTSRPVEEPPALLRERCVISPYNWWKVRWDCVVAAMIVYAVILMPYRIAFGIEAEGGWAYVDVTIDCCFVVDIVLTFMTAYFDEFDVLIKSHAEIAMRYLRGFFVIDFVSVFPIDYLLELIPNSGGGGSARIIRVLRLVRLMKLARLFRLKRLTSLLEEMDVINIHYLTLMKVIGITLFLIHLVACMCYWLATPVCPDGTQEPCNAHRPEDRDGWTNWALMFHVDQLAVEARYLASIHFVTATVMSVGYGDLFPSNTLERTFSIFVQLTGAVVFGFILSAVTTVIESSHPRDTERKHQIADIKEWLNHRELPMGLRMRVWIQLKYVMSQKSIFRDELMILRSLPTLLRNQLVEHLHSVRLQILYHTFREEESGLVIELAMAMNPLQVAQGECLIEAGEPPDEIYFVKSGRLEALLDEQTLQDLDALAAQQSAESAASPNSPGSQSSDGGIRRGPAPTAGATNRSSSPPGKEVRNSVSSAGSLCKRSLSFHTRAINGAISMQKRANMDDPVLCAVYLDMEMACDFPVSPVHVLGGEPRNELLKLNRDELQYVCSHYVGAQDRYGALASEARRQLFTAATSADMAGVRMKYRLKSRIYYRGIATAASKIPSDLFGGSCVAAPGSSGPTPLVVRKLQRESLKLSAPPVPALASETEREILNRWILPPNYSYKVQWDMLVGVMIIYSAVAVPLQCGFNVGQEGVPWVIDLIVDIMFICDMVLCVRTGFLDSEGVLNTVPSEIGWNYLRGWFTIDILSTFPFDWILTAATSSSSGGLSSPLSESRTLKMLRVVRLARLVKLVRLLKLGRLTEMGRTIEIPPVAMRMMSVCIRIFFLAHLMGCGWFYLTLVAPEWNSGCHSGLLKCDHNDTPTTWYAALGSNADANSVTRQYIVSLYWVFTTMTTVGYGDITPTNNIERIYAIIVMIVGATVFGYIVGSIAEISSGSSTATRQYLNILRAYSEEQGLSNRTTAAAKCHFDFRCQEQPPRSEEDVILSSLTPALKKEVVHFIHRNAIRCISLFRRPLPDWFVATLARILEPQAYSPGQTILGPTEAGINQDICFVFDGQCEVFQPEDAASRNTVPPLQREEWSIDEHKELRSPREDGRGIPYGPGTAFGYEPLLREAGVAPLISEPSYFRCCAEAPCFIYALRHGVLNNMHNVQTEFSCMLQDILADTIVHEARRRRRLLEQSSDERSLQSPSPASAGGLLRVPGARGDDSSGGTASGSSAGSGATLRVPGQHLSSEAAVSGDVLQ